MDLLEVDINDRFVIAFDGRVLELFQGSDSTRHHVKLVAVTVSGPDKKGIRHVTFKRASTVGGGGSLFALDNAEFERLRPLLDCLIGAGVRVTA
jgi:hypothetical protein